MFSIDYDLQHSHRPNPTSQSRFFVNVYFPWFSCVCHAFKQPYTVCCYVSLPHCMVEALWVDFIEIAISDRNTCR